MIICLKSLLDKNLVFISNINFFLLLILIQLIKFIEFLLINIINIKSLLIIDFN